jgi:amino acid adenylation domain-containing protein/non-ribosomal peptide synthase protein (TIGR01720 family)
MEGFQLSLQQEQIWSSFGDGKIPLATCAAVAEAALEPASLLAAVRRVALRHDLLRARLHRLPGMSLPLQSWQPEPEIAVMADGEAPDGAAGPGWRSDQPGIAVAVAHPAPGRTRLSLRLPVLFADGWTLRLLMREVADACAPGAGAGGEPPPLQYVQFADWQREMAAQPPDDAGAFWRQRLAGLTPWPGLGGDAAGSARRALGPELTAAVAALAGGLDVAAETVLLAAWLALLWRWAGGSSVAVAQWSPGRAFEELERLAGPVGRHLPVMAPLAASLRFGDLARAVEAEATRARELQDYLPVVERERATLPVCFELESLPAPWISGGVAWAIESLEARLAPAVVRLRCVERSDGLEATVASAREGRWGEVLEQWEELLRAAVAAPEREVGALRLLPERRRPVLLGWGRGERTAASGGGGRAVSEASEGGDGGSVLAQIAAQARERAGAPAVASAGAGEWSYEELWRHAARVARALRRLGVGRESVVGLYLGRSREQVAVLLGVWRAGGAYLPLAPTDPPARLAAMVEAAGACGVVSAGALADRLRAALGERQGDAAATAIWEAGALLGEGEAAAGEPAAFDGEAWAEQAAYVIYTSGSTGRPKGVVVPHGALGNYVRWARAAYGDSAPIDSLVHTPLSFDLTVTSLLVPLAAGGRVELVGEADPGESPAGSAGGASAAGVEGVEGLRRALERDLAAGGGAAGLLKLTPSHLRALAAGWEESGETARRQRCRAMVVGGEPLASDLAARWRAAGGSDGAGGRRLWNEYGPTEAVVGCSAWEAGDDDAGAGNVPIGRPLANVDLYVVDAWGELVPEGVAGELWVGGAGLARGYLGDPAATAERFVPDAWGPGGGRLYRTGDRVRWRAGGVLDHLGRVDEQLKIRGHRIEPAEVEAALRTLPGVREAVVVARAEARSPDAMRLVAYVVGDAGPEEEWRAALRRRLPEPMVPSALVRLERLPLTAHGKVDRRSLPAPETGAGAASWEPPRTPVEMALAAIWSELLGGVRVGRGDNFFELGGDSILSIQAVARARQRGLRLTPRQVFDQPTIRGLAALVEAAPAGLVEAAAEELRGVPLSPIQQWFFAQPWQHREGFVQAMWVEVPEELPAARLAAAVGELVQRHEALRLRFWREDGEWRQGSAEQEEHEVFWQVTASAGGDGGESEAEVARRAQARLDLERGPLVQAVLWEGAGERRLLWMVHHLAVDGVSWRILLEDLERASRGEDLGPKTASWSRWVWGLEQAARSAELEADAAYWLELPPGAAGGEARAGGWRWTAQVSDALGTEETTALLRHVPGVYHTQINDALLAALAAARGETLVMLEGHGREPVQELDVTRTVGWFTSHYPVWLRPAGDPGSSLPAVKEQLRQVPRRGVGFGLLRYLGARQPWRERLAALADSAAVSFNYLGQLDAAAGSPLLRPSLRPVAVGGEAGAGRPAALGLTAWVQGGRLHLKWDYDGERYAGSQVEDQARAYTAALRQLIEHCRGAVGGHTPADFPLARLSGDELARLTAAVPDLADVYPLTPLQAGFLYHALRSPRANANCIQLTCTLEGQLDGERLRQAWELLLARHAALRTVFVWEAVREPVQVVRRSPPPSWRSEDWRGVGEAEQHRRLEQTIAADRNQAYDLEHGPLLRLALIRTGERRHVLLWSNHHLILDGWSTAALVRDLFDAYRAAAGGEAPGWPPVLPFRDHVEWLQRQDRAAAEDFWRRQLAGVEPSLLAAAPGAVASRPDGALQRHRVELDEQLSGQLAAFSRRHQVTLATVMQGAWALLLTAREERAEVVFGTISAGRTGELAGAGGIIGLLINTLPLRVRVRRAAGLAEWLQELQRDAAAARQYDYASLPDIQRWSGLAAGQPLFDSLLVFENYPVPEDVLGPDLAATAMTHYIEESYPLVLTVVPAARIRLDCRHATGAARWAGALPAIERLLARILAAPAAALVGEIAAAAKVVDTEAEAASVRAYEDAWRGFQPRGR